MGPFIQNTDIFLSDYKDSHGRHASLKSYRVSMCLGGWPVERPYLTAVVFAWEARIKLIMELYVAPAIKQSEKGQSILV
jgi:hypothetical protein